MFIERGVANSVSFGEAKIIEIVVIGGGGTRCMWVGFGSLACVTDGYGRLALGVAIHTLGEVGISFLVVISL